MIAAVVVALVALALGALLALRVTVRAQVKAVADAGGSWRAAAGGAVGPLAFTAGVSPAGAAWTAHVLGRPVARGTRAPRLKARPMSPLRALAVARRALRRVRFDRLEARVRGAAGDPATSAQLLGMLSAVGAMLAPRAVVVGDVDWMAEAPFVDIDCELEASFVPVALGWAGWAALRASRRKPRKADESP